MKAVAILKFVLLVVSTVLVLLGMFGAMEIDAMLIWAGVLLALTALLALAMPLVGIFQNPKSARRSLLGLGVLAVVLLVSYALSSDEPVRVAGGTQIFDDKAGLMVTDTALYAMYIAMFGAFGSIVFGEIYKLIKN